MIRLTWEVQTPGYNDTAPIEQHSTVNSRKEAVAIAKAAGYALITEHQNGATCPSSTFGWSYAHQSEVTARDLDNPHCGTAGCIAGWVTALSAKATWVLTGAYDRTPTLFDVEALDLYRPANPGHVPCGSYPELIRRVASGNVDLWTLKKTGR